MWVKVDDTFPEHRKVTEAGRHLGPYGVGRVIAVWIYGMCYCNRNLTDGYVTAQVWRSWTLVDRRPLDVADVMALPMPNGSAGLLERVEGGYQFHDYAHYQPNATTVKEKRQRDRERKRPHRPVAVSPARAGRRRGPVRVETINPKVLVKLGHVVLDEHPRQSFTPSELADELKWIAAKTRVPYDATSVHTAAEVVLAQRKRGAA